MHYSQSEKYEMIQLVEQSDLGINRTLKELKINKTTFYNWYNLYTQKVHFYLTTYSSLFVDVIKVQK